METVNKKSELDKINELDKKVFLASSFLLCAISAFCDLEDDYLIKERYKILNVLRFVYEQLEADIYN